MDCVVLVRTTSNNNLGFSQSDQNHYDNTPIQYTVKSHGRKNSNFQMILYIFFVFFAHNIDRGYALEPPH